MMAIRLQEVIVTARNKRVIPHLFSLIWFIMFHLSYFIRMFKDQRDKKEGIRLVCKIKGWFSLEENLLR